MERFIPNQNNSLQTDGIFSKKDKRTFLIVGGVILILVGVLVYIILSISNPKNELPGSNENIEGEHFSPETAQSLISCKNWDCFINASKNCDKSNFTVMQSIDMFGMNITTITYYELKGQENGKCIFYLRTEEQHINFSAGLIQNYLDSGTTSEEIQQQEQEANKQSDLLEGRDGQCNIENSKLAEILTKWKEGTFQGSVSCKGTECNYGGDWEFFNNCKGSYFSSEI